MTRKLILSIMLLLTFSFINVYSICPAGYTSGGNVTFTPEGWLGCTITVSWCYVPANPPSNPYPDIYFSSYTINGPCTINVDYAPGIIPPTIEEFLSGLADNSSLFRSVMGIPDNPESLQECGGVWNSGGDYDVQCRVFTGACYHQVPSGDPLIQAFEICDPGYWGQCREFYRFCKQYINGHWVRSVYSTGQPSALFQCTPPCFPKCQ